MARKPSKISPAQLKKHGYKWKLQHLTKEEKEWARNGIPVEGKPNVRKPAPDYFYYYKPVEGGECRIYKVGDKFYYGEGGGGTPVDRVNQLEICERLSKDNAKYAEMAKNLQDTEPKFQIKKDNKPYEFNRGTDHAVKQLKNIGEPIAKVTDIQEDEKGLTISYELLPGHIYLKGGPLNGKIVKYDNRFKGYMAQVMVGEGADRRVTAPRYKQSKEDKNIYDYDTTL